MKIIDSPEEMQKQARRLIRSGKTIGFVSAMDFLQFKGDEKGGRG